MRWPKRALQGVLLACFACSRDPSTRGADEPLATVSAEELRDKVRALGAKAILVNAWATWCDSCQEELPTLQTLADRMAPKGVRVLLVSVDEPEDRARAKSFLSEHAIHLPTYLAARPLGAFKSALDPRWPGMLPASFLFDGTGKVRYFWGGEAYDQDLVPVVEGLLEGKTIDGETRFDLAPGATSPR
jgi:thiol-disulfide isomerase/thioredoxin